MNRFLPLFLTLRGRLILLICLATLPAILFTFYIAQNERHTALQRMENDSRHNVNLISREYLYQMAGAKQLLKWLAATLARAGNESLITDGEFLAALLAGYPQLANIAILAPDGEVINSAYPLSEPMNMHDYDAIQRALQSREIETGTYVIGPIVKRSLLHLTYAIRGGGNQVSRIVFVAIDLEWLRQLTAQAELPAEHALLIVDRAGKILASSAVPDSKSFRAGREIPELAGLAPRGASPVSARIDDRRLAFHTAPMEGITGVFIASALPHEQIFRKANQIFYRTLGWLSLLTLFTVISVLVVEEVALLRAVRALSGAVQRFGKGDHTSRVDISQGYGELHDMAQAFNVMADTMTRRHQELISAHQQLDRLTRHLQVAREAEAQRISRDLHDEVGQVLTSIKMDLAAFRKACNHARSAPCADLMIEESISDIQKKIDDIVTFIRRLAADLRPPVLDHMGLASAIDILARNLEDSGDVMIDVEAALPAEPANWMVSTTLYRIIQEALTNISRHARATEVHIRLRLAGDSYILEVEDNGVGFEADKRENSTLGLLGMRERARLVGGKFFLRSAPGEGTLIRITIPDTPKEDNHYAYPSG